MGLDLRGVWDRRLGRLGSLSVHARGPGVNGMERNESLGWGLARIFLVWIHITA